VIKNERSVVRTKKSESNEWAKDKRTLGIMWSIISEEVNAHAPTSTQQRKGERGAREDHQGSVNYLYLHLEKAVDPNHH
jgi:hypothetical protein